jgi:hypothetical protein
MVTIPTTTFASEHIWFIFLRMKSLLQRNLVLLNKKSVGINKNAIPNGVVSMIKVICAHETIFNIKAHCYIICMLLY